MAKRVPYYEFLGGTSYTKSDDKHWYIYLTSSGTLTMRFPKRAEVFIVGGGGAGGTGQGAGGGGGGYTKTFAMNIAADTDYDITVGRGGTPVMHHHGGDGTATTAFGQTVNGGKGGKGNTGEDNPWPGGSAPGGNGGCGGGAGTYAKPEDGGRSGDGGSDGGNGGRSEKLAGGTGQGSTTRAFGSGALYAGGGGGAARKGDGGAGGAGGGGAGEGDWREDEVIKAKSGTANTGGGGGGGTDEIAGYGGSGVVIIRGTELDFLPIFYNGTRLQQLFFNDQEVRALDFNGISIYKEGD